MKKVLIVLIILLTGALSLYLYSENSQRNLAPALNSKKITPDKQINLVSSKTPSGLIDVPRRDTDVGKTPPVEEAAQKPSERAIEKQIPDTTVDNKSEVVPPVKEIKQTTKGPEEAVKQTPPSVITTKDDVVPAGKETVLPAVKNEILPLQESAGKAEPFAGKADHKAEVVPDSKTINEKKESKPEAVIRTAPAAITIKDETVPAAKETVPPAAKKEILPAQETSGNALVIKGKAEATTEVVTLAADIIKPVDKPGKIKEEKKAAITTEAIKQPGTKTAPAVEEPGLTKEKTAAIPPVSAIVIPSTPSPVPVQQASAGTRDIVPAVTKSGPLAITETPVAASRPEKRVETKKTIPVPETAAVSMVKAETFPGDMLTRGKNGRIAIFPFENLSDNRDAFRHVLPLLIDKLEKRGFKVVDDDELNSFLCSERVRTTGYVSRELSDKIRKRFNVSAIFTGAIVSFSTEDIPQFGILARIIDPSDSRILWADYSAATGEDFIAILELGRLKSVFSLMPKVVDILFASLKASDLNRESKSLHRVAVMPFKNNSDFNNAGIISTYMFITEMLKSQQFIPIEYGDTRNMIIKLDIRRKGDIGYENIGGLAKELKVRGILVGTVDNYSDGAAGSMAPNVGFTARLVDGSNNKILWYNTSQLSGEENIIALDWGRIRSVHTVAYKAVSGLVKEMARKKWRD